MRKKQKERLDWFINFINLDLDELPTAEKSKIAAETGLILYGHDHKNREPMIFFSNPRLTEFLENPGIVDALHNYLKRFFKDVMEKVEHVLSNPHKWKTEKKLIEYLTFSQVEMRKTVVMSVDPGKLEDRLEIKKDAQNQFRLKDLKTATLKANIEGFQRYEDAFLTEFMNSLDAVPLGAFKKCKECETWYIHLSKRAKTFCTNKCAARYGARRRRQKQKQEDPDSYAKLLKQGAERAHKAYRKKVEKKSSGKPARRPIKYKAS